MIQRVPFKQLFMIMATATLMVSAIAIFSLYTTAIEQHRLRLVETLKSQARLIEAVAQYDGKSFGKDNPELAWQATLGQVEAAHRAFKGFGESGEFVLARRLGDEIHFMLGHRHPQELSPQKIPFEGRWAEPMRRALSGDSGIVEALDYRGVEVLAAYEPLSFLDMGLVAKIDTAELRKPFLQATLITLGLTLLIIFIASRLFFRVFRPIENMIVQQAETFRTLAETAQEGIVIASTKGIIEYANPSIERLFGYKPGELEGASVKCLMPNEQSAQHDTYMQRYLQTGFPRIIGSGRHLIAKRRDGSRFPIYLSIGDINTSDARRFAGVILDMSEQQQLQREILEIPVSEQRRIGQELHDGLGQQLTGLGLLATSLVNKASKPEHELATRLAQGLQQAISQVRALSRGLMPVDIDAEGFSSSLQILVDEIRANCNISIALKIRERIRVPDNSSALHLYRVAQEALNNAVKHAQAKRIEITLGKEGDLGLLSIRDDGLGFEASPQKFTGLGLRIMQHRCSLIDAQFEIQSSPGDGTEVKCRFPIEKQY